MIPGKSHTKPSSPHGPDRPAGTEQRLTALAQKMSRDPQDVLADLLDEALPDDDDFMAFGQKRWAEGDAAVARGDYFEGSSLQRSGRWLLHAGRRQRDTVTRPDRLRKGLPRHPRGPHGYRDERCDSRSTEIGCRCEITVAARRRPRRHHPR